MFRAQLLILARSGPAKPFDLLSRRPLNRQPGGSRASNVRAVVRSPPSLRRPLLPPLSQPATPRNPAPSLTAGCGSGRRPRRFCRSAVFHYRDWERTGMLPPALPLPFTPRHANVFRFSGLSWAGFGISEPRQRAQPYPSGSIFPPFPNRQARRIPHLQRGRQPDRNRLLHTVPVRDPLQRISAARWPMS